MTTDPAPLPKQYWYQMTSMDLRSMALFRVALALALACTLVALMGATPLWFSDGGLMPRTDSIGLGGLAAHNLTLVTGKAWLLNLMLLTGLLAALTLLIGYRTRFSLTVATLVLLSFVTRQPLVSLPHEIGLAGLALWSLCLPLGLRWSLDATLGTTQASAVSDTRRGGLIGLGWSLQWLVLAGAALMSPLKGEAATLALAGALALVLGVLARMMIATVSSWRWLTPALTLLGAVLILVTQPAPTSLIVVAALAVMPWLPGALWTNLGRRHAKRPPVQIFYDGDCRFCHQSCRVLKDMLILPPGSRLGPAQDNPRAFALMKAQDSWVVIDDQGRASLHWLAGVTLVRHSAWLAPLGPVLALAPLRAAGDLLYRQVVRHRGLLASVFDALPPASKPTSMAALALTALTLMVAQGVSAVTQTPRLTGSPPGLAFSGFVTPAVPSINVQGEGQWVAAVERVPGQYRDALRGDQALDYRLTPTSGAYSGRRWQHYLAAAGEGERGLDLRRLATRLCSTGTRPARAVNLEWIVPADTGTTRTQRQRVFRYRCVDGVAQAQRQRLDSVPTDLQRDE
ncbi:hypothetical protein [Polycyclovorans algicola]|uniref:hypothetical protein n=1 Tax=Polycyclovorans algicola TaxID=616992 RepID=UPI0004A7388E|nr:hypothetical protein [Polycyclovorans algicola]